MLTFVRTLGVPTPAVHFVDISHHLIVMDFIEGQQLKQLVGVSSKKRITSLCHEFGKLLGIMHLSDVVHGDPTTSNVVVDTQSKMWLVDFGLAEKNATIETWTLPLTSIQSVDMNRDVMNLLLDHSQLMRATRIGLYLQ
jgi:Kae1-associated kinase Bud32